MFQASDIDLQLYLLQLVQALKYEKSCSDVFYEDTLTSQTGLSEGTMSESAQSLPPGNISIEEETAGSMFLENQENLNLASFLIWRACNNSSLANYFYWYLLIECEELEGGMKKDELMQFMYKTVLNKFLSTLEKGSSVLRERKLFLERQHTFLDRIVGLVKNVAKESGNRKKKIEKLQSLLKESDTEDFSFLHFDPIPFPLDPEVRITGIVPEKTTLFKSSLMPAKLTFTTDTGEEYVAIFKLGDDLRQDQLILQVEILI